MEPTVTRQWIARLNDLRTLVLAQSLAVVPPWITEERQALEEEALLGGYEVHLDPWSGFHVRLID